MRYFYLILILLFILQNGITQTNNYPWETLALEGITPLWTHPLLDSTLYSENEHNGSAHLIPFEYVPVQIKGDYIYSVLWSNVTDYEGWFYEKVSLKTGKTVDQSAFDFRHQDTLHHHVPMAMYVATEGYPVITSIRNIKTYKPGSFPYIAGSHSHHVSKQVLEKDNIRNYHPSDSDSMITKVNFPYGSPRLFYADTDTSTHATHFSWSTKDGILTWGFVKETYNANGYRINSSDTIFMPVPDTAFGGISLNGRTQMFADNGTSVILGSVIHRDQPDESVLYAFQIDQNWNVLNEFDLREYFSRDNGLSLLGVGEHYFTLKNRIQDTVAGDHTVILTLDYEGNVVERIEGITDGSMNYNYFSEKIYYPDDRSGIISIGRDQHSKSIDIWQSDGQGNVSLIKRFKPVNPKKWILPISVEITPDKDVLMLASVRKDTVVNGSSETWGYWKYMILLDGEELGLTTALDNPEVSAVDYSLYPNPTHGLLRFEWPAESKGTVKELMLTTSSGKVAVQKKLAPYDSECTFSLAPGIYQLRITDERGMKYKTKKVVVME